MSDRLVKDISRDVFGAQAGRSPTAPQPAYCLDIVTTVPSYTTYYVTDRYGVTRPVVVSTGTSSSTTHWCTSGSPGDPGSPARAPTTRVSFNLAWNGGADSVGDLTGDGQFQFSVYGGSVGVVCGLNDVNEGAGYVEIDFGIYCTNGAFTIIEGGVERTAPAAFATSDVFTIRRLNGEIAYFKNSTRVYTSLARSYVTLFADASMYAGGDTIIDPSLSATVATSFASVSGGTNGILTGLSGFAANLSGGWVGSPPPTGSGDPGGGPGTGGGTDSNGDWPGRSGGVLRNIVGHAEAYNNGTITTGGGTGSGGGGATGNGDFIGRSGNQLRGLTGAAFGSSDVAGTPNPGTYYAICSGRLNDPFASGDAAVFTGYSEAGMLEPAFAIVSSALTPLAGFGIALAGMVGVVNPGALGGLRGFGANTDGADVSSGTPTAGGTTNVYVFHDTFTGTGDLSTHSPDVGGSYTAGLGSNLTHLVLSSGSLSDNTAAIDTAISTIPTLTATTFSMSVTFTLPAIGGPSDAAYLDFAVADSGGVNWWVDAYIHTSDGGTTWTLSPATPATFVDVNVSAYLTPGTHTLRTDVTPTDIRFYIDGVYIAAATLATDTPTTPITEVITAIQRATGYSLTVDETAVYTTISVPGGVVVDPPGAVDGSGDWAGRAGGVLRMLVGVAFDSTAIAPAFLLGDLPGTLRLFALGHADTLTDAGGNPVAGYGVHASLPVPTLVATGGTAVRMTLPVPTLTCTGTTTILGTVESTIPVPTLTASGTTTIVARLDAELPAGLTLAARGGARVGASLPVPTLVASGTTGRLARSAATIPSLTLVARGTVGQVGSIQGVLSGLRAGNSGVVVVTTPRVELRATGRADVTVEYEAYSICLIPDQSGGTQTATTRYTNYPFDRIVRFGSKYYGVAADGLYELEGNDFDGTPIVSTVQTAESDFGKKHPKRPTAVWLSGDLPTDLKVSCLTDGEDVSGVKYRDRIVKDSVARRVFFGRGARGHWLSFKFTNATGKDFEIEEFEPEIDVLRRDV